MISSLQINDRNYRIDLDEPIDISIPLDFNGAQPNAYGVEKASAQACEAGDLVGDTRRGGSCNFEQYKFIPHCNGTHTESIGHITKERISVRDCLKDAFIPATLVSIQPEKAIVSGESYSIDFGETDELITRKAIENALGKAEACAMARARNDLGFGNADFGFEPQLTSNPKSQIPNPKFPSPCGALIVRTLPNEESKKTRAYLDNVPPFFSTEAMRFMVEKGIRHLLVDTPSIDRTFDEGKLSNHRIFWNVKPGSFEITKKSLINHTITELIFVPDEVEDGDYLLNLQIAPFVADASPSRPLLFKLITDN
ncbi:MAG: cyclase family protein [Acidobacteriota bacterium]|nr:cyclase family protein [Acidobacteriota bacterium]